MATSTGSKRATLHPNFSGRLASLLRKSVGAEGCRECEPGAASGQTTILIVGTPNVGKSVTFNRLTGAYVTVSNYPGTTVEVSRGKSTIAGLEYEIIDTPGMYSLLPITAEERVGRAILLRDRPGAVVHVVDAKNLDRMLPMTLQLIEAGLPVILNLNMMDEADRLGIRIDIGRLSEALGVPVIPTVATSGRGFDELRAAIVQHATATQNSCHADHPEPPERLRHSVRIDGQPSESNAPAPLAGGHIARYPVHYDERVENRIARLASLLTADYGVSHRTMLLLAVQGDQEAIELICQREGLSLAQFEERAAGHDEAGGKPFPFVIAMTRQAAAEELVELCTSSFAFQHRRLSETLGRLTINPLTGVPILLIVLYFGLYRFVGQFGAGTLVAFFENNVFGDHINPMATQLVESVVPWPILRTLFVGEYGIITLGVRYAVAIILPVVGTFFIVFSVLEDTGYFPRLAMLIDRLMKGIGLNGRAIIPLVLGLGCDTMATVVTRVLESRRERIVATLLLALGVPCSAQLGVTMAILSPYPMALLLWVVIVALVFVLVGFLASRVMPGERPSFYMELPPLRLPQLSNVITKTYTRMEWYLLEVLPVFLVASVLIWLGQVTGVFQWLVDLLQPVMLLLGLPRDAAAAFLFGFFRRDYGAAGLYDLAQNGALNAQQMLVAAVTLTLFVPCIAQFSVMLKERGTKTTLGIVAFIIPFAFVVGFAVNWVLVALGVTL